MRSGGRVVQAVRVTEEQLPGGFVTTVVRIGETVRRKPAPPFVHRLLEFLAASGWNGAPRFLGHDSQGREMLSFLDGYVAWESPWPEAVVSTESLTSVGRLVREFHDLTAGTALAGDQEVVCHNDLSPKNTVYADDGARAIAFIDWDIAAPGRRIHDLAFICWQYADLGRTPVQLVIDRWRALCDGYGPTDRGDLVDTVLWWQDRAWRGIEAAASAGDEAMTRLRDVGVPADIRTTHDWVAAHRALLTAATA